MSVRFLCRCHRSPPHCGDGFCFRAPGRSVERLCPLCETERELRAATPENEDCLSQSCKPSMPWYMEPSSARVATSGGSFNVVGSGHHALAVVSPSAALVAAPEPKGQGASWSWTRWTLSSPLGPQMNHPESQHGMPRHYCQSEAQAGASHSQNWRQMLQLDNLGQILPWQAYQSSIDQPPFGLCCLVSR